MRFAFTLMELLVSVVLIALITLFMYGAIASSKTTAYTLKKHSVQEHNRTLLYELFYRDIMESLWIRPEQALKRRFTVVQMQTRNSLYDIAAPHVLYYVRAETKTLIRLESARTISMPVNYESKNYIFADELAKNVDDFNLYANAAEGNTTAVPVSGDDERAPAEVNTTKPQSSPAMVKRYLLYLNSKAIPYMLLDLTI